MGLAQLDLFPINEILEIFYEKLLYFEDLLFRFFFNSKLNEKNFLFIIFLTSFPFLDAFSHLYKKVCPSVGQSVTC